MRDLSEMQALRDRLDQLALDFRHYEGPGQSMFKCLSYCLDDILWEANAELKEHQPGSTLPAGNPHPATAAVPDRGADPKINLGSPVSLNGGA